MSKTHAFHATARFGLDAKPGEIAHIASDPKGWILEQITRPDIPQAVLQRHGGVEAMLELARSQKAKDKESAKEARKAMKEVYVRESGARIMAQAQSDQPFVERMVNFWSNHFTISIQKDTLVGAVNQYEVEAIRPHIGGYFKDMLLAVAQHPGMLMYLDNVQSIGPNSRVGKRRKKGLNENLAREILELHTLGVSGGYTQQDVQELAKMITGWTLKRVEGTALPYYEFQPAMHEPGNKVLLGQAFKENGEQEGIDALTMLANHPSTAWFISYKLVQHYINDSPEVPDIEKVSRTYLKTGGHLPSVMATLLSLPNTWSNPLSKLKNPYEYIVSAMRATGASEEPKKLMQALDMLHFRLFNASSPAGYKDVATAWSSPDGIMKRIEWAHAFAQKHKIKNDPYELAQSVIGPVMSSRTSFEIKGAESGTDGLVLLLASPEFQRR